MNHVSGCCLNSPMCSSDLDFNLTYFVQIYLQFKNSIDLLSKDIPRFTSFIIQHKNNMCFGSNSQLATVIKSTVQVLPYQLVVRWHNFCTRVITDFSHGDRFTICKPVSRRIYYNCYYQEKIMKLTVVRLLPTTISGSTATFLPCPPGRASSSVPALMDQTQSNMWA